MRLMFGCQDCFNCMTRAFRDEQALSFWMKGKWQSVNKKWLNTLDKHGKVSLYWCKAGEQIVQASNPVKAKLSRKPCEFRDEGVNNG